MSNIYPLPENIWSNICPTCHAQASSLGTGQTHCVHAAKEKEELARINTERTREALEQRRTRLIERYAGIIYSNHYREVDAEDAVGLAVELADAVIKATSNE